MNNSKREFYSEHELKQMAVERSQYLYVRTMENGCSHDTRRKATRTQSAILYGVIYGALLGLNYGDDVRSNRNIEHAIVDTAEFQADILMRNHLKPGEELQGYMTVYIPLNEMLAQWRRE